MRKLSLALVALCVGIAACDSEQLVVTNPNNPNVSRVLATPTDVENYIGASWTAWWNAAMAGTNEQLRPPMMAMSFETSSGLNNFGMGPRSAFPRSFIDNSLGNGFSAQNYYNYSHLEAAGRQAANGLAKLTGTFTLGTAQRDARARAWGWFVLGLSNGDNSLIYDSVAVVTPRDVVNPSAAPAALIGAAAANAIALQQLDSAITYANAWSSSAAPPNTANKNTLESTWMPLATGSINAAQLVGIIRSYKAHFRADVARTPAQRAAVNWAAIIADASAGMTTDLTISINSSLAVGTTSPIADGQHYSFSTWHQQSPMIIGMADSVRGVACTASTANGDCYDAWLTQSLDSRYRFLIATADKRFPQGGTRSAQQATPGLYFRNHLNGQDSPAGPQDLSEYDQIRFLQTGSNAQGPYIIFTRAELDLLAAEGYIRGGDFASAAASINVSRVAKGGLPPVPVVGNATDAIAAGIGANSCVPRVPQPPNFTSAACGNIMEAMKWEKRMETALTTFGAWFYDSRGWGDLPFGTALEWPTPYQELQFYNKKPYNVGGVGGADAAPKSTYGY